ncbi:YfbU family protein [Burkholderia sp. BCC1640]|uniref:YfbU family protein n=1 Tax=Burkholderia sp. BCC1640 TaxID=2676294 RepID=UPI00158DA620|nr:YfbU family protein [Burkholderia sp. BCC1640]
MKMTNAEKLMTFMLAEILEGLKTKGEIDPKFVKEAIFHDHLWGLEWKYQGIFGDSVEPTPEPVKFVIDVLDMWSFIERGYKGLSAGDKARVDAEVPYGISSFEGFDGNNETEYMSIARFFVEELDRFTEFKGREFNSHMPSIARYRAMLAVFEPIRKNLREPRHLNADELIKIGKR